MFAQPAWWRTRAVKNTRRRETIEGDGRLLSMLPFLLLERAQTKSTMKKTLNISRYRTSQMLLTSSRFFVFFFLNFIFDDFSSRRSVTPDSEPSPSPGHCVYFENYYFILPHTQVCWLIVSTINNNKIIIEKGKENSLWVSLCVLAMLYRVCNALCGKSIKWFHIQIDGIIEFICLVCHRRRRRRRQTHTIKPIRSITRVDYTHNTHIYTI